MIRKRKKKTVKGMTLIEIMISIAVLGIAGLVMVTCGSVTANIMRNTNSVQRKTVAQAPAVASHGDNAPESIDDDPADIVITVGSADSNGEIQPGKVYSTVTAKKYSTASLDTQDETSQYNFNGNLEFYVLDETETTAE